MEEALVSHLLAVASVRALVETRVYWARRPQSSALPSIVLTRISGRPVYSHSGAADLTESRVQVDCWGATYSQAKQVARAVSTTLSGAQFERGGVDFRGVFSAGERDDFEVGQAGVEIHRVSLDFILWTDGN